MKATLTSLLGWLSGKKTYLLAAILLLTVGVFVFLGRLTPQVAMTVALVFLGLFAASFRDALAKHQAQVIQFLEDTALVGKLTLAKNGKAAAIAGVALATDASELVGQIQAEQASAGVSAK
jgi:uncharacterized membrane protein YphA (DoxX/SURF4 family)